jgi:hypothetical protein
VNLIRGKAWRIVLIGWGAVLCGVIGWFIFAVVDYLGVTKEAKSHDQRLDRLQGRVLFPSEENVEAVRKNYEGLVWQLSELEADLKRDPYAAEAGEAAGFSAEAQRRIERFRLRASLAGVAVSDALEASFAEYASGGKIPEPQHVERLSRQLFAATRVGDLLLEAEVERIDEINREPFEAAVVEPMIRARGRRGRFEQPAEQEMDFRLLASEIDEQGLYSVERIEARFVAKELSLWKVLDGVASHPHFMVLSRITLETDAEILAYDPEAVKRAGEGDDEMLRYLAGGILEGKNALSRPERVVAGDESIEVQLVVEVYHFAPLDALGGRR